MAVGFLANLIEDARATVDDPIVSGRHTNAEILRWAGASFRKAFRDVTAFSARRVVLTHDIIINTTDVLYELPPCVGEILTWGEMFPDGLFGARDFGPSRFSPCRAYGIWLEGNRLRLSTRSMRTYTLRIEYVPGPHFNSHAGVVVFDDASGANRTTDLSSSQFPLVDISTQTSSTVPYGEIEYRKNGFVGQILRLWPNTGMPVVQQRLITAQTLNPSATFNDAVLTLDMPLDNVPASGQTWNYEILPMGMEAFRLLVALGTGITLATLSAQRDRIRDLERQYVIHARTEKLWEAYYTMMPIPVDTHQAYRGGYRR